MRKEIDRIVEAFVPEMARISGLDESEAQKERHAKTWLRGTLETFARKITEDQEAKRASDPPGPDLHSKNSH
jgi:hypothetical protein